MIKRHDSKVLYMFDKLLILSPPAPSVKAAALVDIEYQDQVCHITI